MKRDLPEIYDAIVNKCKNFVRKIETQHMVSNSFHLDDYYFLLRQIDSANFHVQ